MVVSEREQVLALSPDTASTVAAQRLAAPGRWSALGRTPDIVWGRCQGSGRAPYQTVVKLEPPVAYDCTCPSRKSPCKHVLALLLLQAANRVPAADSLSDFAGAWAQSRTEPRPRADSGDDKPVVDPEAARRRAAARVERVGAGLDDLDRWLHDQIRGGMAGLERAGYAHFDRVAARMVDAQAPGVASMLRSIPAELGADGWPERVLDRLAALHLLIRAHRRLGELPPELAANVRSRVGYPVSKADVLASAAVRDHWQVLGLVDTVEYQLETRRVWLYGSSSRRWAVSLSFAVPGQRLDGSVLPGQLRLADLHFYPGSGYRALVDVRDEPGPLAAPPPADDLADTRQRFARLLADDPWATRMPAVVSAAPVRPERPGGRWRLRDDKGRCVDAVGVADLWPVLARSCGDPVHLFGEWETTGFRPLSALPDVHGGPFTAGVAG